MRALLLTTAAALTFAAQPASADPARPADIVAVQQVSEPDLAPDGSAVVYTLEVADTKEDALVSHIWLANWDGSGTRQLTFRKGESESLPRFSPDGRSIAFLSARDPGEDDEDVPNRLWLLPRAGGEARAITGVAGSVSDYAFSPDGRHLVLVVMDAKPEEKEEKTGDAKDEEGSDRPKPIVIDRYRFKQDGVGYLDNRRERLWLYDIAAGTARRLTDGDHDEALPAWSPDGRQIAFVSRRIPESERSADHNLWIADVAKPGAAPRQLTRYSGADNDPSFGSYPAWSPDGRSIAYIRTGDPKLIWYAANDLAVVPASGGEERVLTAALDRNVFAPAWTEDGATIRFLVEDDGVQRLSSIAAAGGAVREVKGGEFVLAEPDMGPGGRMALRYGSFGAPDEIYALDGGTLRPLTRHNEALVKRLDLGAVERLSVTSKDGTEVRGFLQLPPGYRKGRRVPAMLMIHGGPTAQYDASFDMMREIFSAAGYAVIFVNPRGSTGRGSAYSAAIKAAWGTVDVEDVLAAVDAVVARGIADPDRLVIGGWSYGGMLTNYTIASDTRFKAAVSGASIGNILAGYGTDHYVYEYDVELGYPWEKPEVWQKLSYPFFHNDRIVTPTLFMVGGDDVNVPTLASEQMYQALKTRGIDTRLVIYPGESHGIARPSFQIDRMQRWLDWYASHLKK